MRMLDLFSGRWGWSKAFAARGWECLGVDLIIPPDTPEGCRFAPIDVLDLKIGALPGFIGLPFLGDYEFDFICASSPCEQFSVHGMKCFHPNPPYPELGIKLFNHTRALCQASGIPYVMENVRAAQEFIGPSVHHCGPFHLWGTGVPVLLIQGITKGANIGGNLNLSGTTLEQRRQLRATVPRLSTMKHPRVRREFTAQMATIPPELSNCVAEYAERLIEGTL